MINIQGKTHFGPSSIVTDGLELYLDAANPKSYIGSGGDWNDLIKPITLTERYSPTFSGGYFSVDGADGFNSQSDLLDIPLTTQLTMCVWYRRVGNGGTNNNRLVEVREAGSSQAYSHSLILEGTTGNPSFWLDDNSASPNRFIDYETTYTPTNNEWHYLVGTYNSPNMVVYLDGNVIGSTNGATSKLDDINNISVGYYVLSSSDYYFNGDISIVQIYNKELSQEQVLQNYNSTKNRYI